MKIVYRNIMYEAEEETLVHLLREKNLTYREIGKIIGKSYQTVALMLKRMGRNGKLDFKGLLNPYIYSRPDIYISAEYNANLTTVTNMRKMLGLPLVQVVDLSQRRNFLANYLFERKAGPKFPNFLQTLSPFFTETKGENLLDFYVRGKTQSLSDDVLTDNDRVYRTAARKDLKEVVEAMDIEDLVKGGVLE